MSTSGPFTTLGAAVEAASAGDEIEIAGTIEASDSVFVRVPLTFIGVGPAPAVVARGLLRSGRGILVTESDVTIRNVEFRGARAVTWNGSGIWHDKGNLVLEDCLFIDNQNGVMVVGHESDALHVKGSRFVGNGGGCGHTHGLYITGNIRLAEFELCEFDATRAGHHLKSKARETLVEKCYFCGLPGSTTSCAIDLPAGGNAVISGSLFVKSRESMSARFISYCSESGRLAKSDLTVRNNIFISHRRLPSVAVRNYSRAVRAFLEGNAYEKKTIFASRGRGKDVA
ncbi:MAG: hypothetical protein ACREFZ_08025, partial [Acetobacteraceae bacterium]